MNCQVKFEISKMQRYKVVSKAFATLKLRMMTSKLSMKLWPKYRKKYISIRRWPFCTVPRNEQSFARFCFWYTTFRDYWMSILYAMNEWCSWKFFNWSNPENFRTCNKWMSGNVCSVTEVGDFPVTSVQSRTRKHPLF